MDEIWKPVPGYEGYYQVSSLGNIKSKRKLLNPYTNVHGYQVVSLLLKGVRKQWKVHQVVALSFLDYTFKNHGIIIDHIDGCKTNNYLSNLQLISQRENKSKLSKKTGSKYTGVYFQKKSGKYTAMIYVKDKIKYLGLFETEEEASEYYQNALKEYNNTGKISIFKKRKRMYSEVKYISYSKIAKKYTVVINKKLYGYHETEEEAIKKLEEILKRK